MALDERNVAQFKKRISIVQELSEKCWSNFLLLMDERTLYPKEHFSRELSRTKELGFIINGLVRIYAVDEEGAEWNKSLLRANEFIMASINPSLPSPVNIQAIFTTDIFTISYGDFMKLAIVYPEMSKLISVLSSEHITREKNRNNLLMIKKSADRLAHFKNEFADIYQKISKEHIASFIGISSEDII